LKMNFRSRAYRKVFWIMAGVWLLLPALGALAALPAGAPPAAAQVGPYNVCVESVGRVLDFTQPPENQSFTFVTLSIEGQPEAVERLLENTQDPAATDNSQKRLTFQEIRLPSRSAPAGRKGAVKTPVQVWFSAADPKATALQSFSASLVCYEKKENLRIDFLSVAGEEFSSRPLNGLILKPTVMGPQEDPRGEHYEVQVEVRDSGEKPDQTERWENEQIELIDAEGQPKTALSTARTYQYDESGKIAARTIAATFPLPTRPPRGLRYRVEHLLGVQALPYRFENLPLP